MIHTYMYMMYVYVRSRRASLYVHVCMCCSAVAGEIGWERRGEQREQLLSLAAAAVEAAIYRGLVRRSTKWAGWEKCCRALLFSRIFRSLSPAVARLCLSVAIGLWVSILPGKRHPSMGVGRCCGRGKAVRDRGRLFCRH
ncbi:hypothetical protein V8C26DRAFT_60250 [Trichoderma gracile]